MQLEALKIFCDVVRLASFSRAAKENEVSQSSASQVVLQLENRLGAKLLDRSKRPLTTTEAGRVYYEGCRTLLAHYQELENRVRQQVDETPLDGSVKVSSIYSVGLIHMVRIIANFREKHPQAQVKIEYHHPSAVLESVLDESSELGLISFPKKWPELVVLPWREERMVLAVPPGHRFADRAEILPEEIAGERFVAFDDGLPIRRAIDRFFRQHAIMTEIALEFDNIENIKRAVEIGSGVAILPEPTMAAEQKLGSLVAVPIKNDAEPLVRPLAIIHRKHRALSPVGQRFLQRLMDDSTIERSAPAANGHSSNGHNTNGHSSKKTEGTDGQEVVSPTVSRVGEGNVVSI